jgi:putative ABC transport system ATP-binding protein
VEVASLYREPEAPEAEAAPPALELVDAFRIYRQGPVETVALRGLDLRVEQGEMVALLGPSGCGKSTLLNLAAGLDEPSAGEVRAFGRPLNRLAGDDLAAYRASQIAIVFQHANLWPDLTAAQNVQFGLRLAGIPHPQRAAREALAGFGLADRAGQLAGSLSGGEHQLVAIAAAAARSARLVLCDEPTGELDSANERRVIDALRHLQSDYAATIIVVTHSADLASASDRIVEIRDGRLA